MEVKISYTQKDIKTNQKKLYEKFVDFLKDKYPLKDDLEIIFLNNRRGKMTTGAREKNLLKILVKNRMNRDILRTIAHEWVHEYQRLILKRKKGLNIGGKNEDEANAIAGQLVKKFEAKNQKLEGKIFKQFNERISTIYSVLNENLSSKTNIITEIKKVSIEKLPYDYDSVSSFIDSETMKTHYNKHYKGYVEKLNVELEKIKGKDLDLEQIIGKISKYNNIVKNNGGGAFNHALFWKMLSPKQQVCRGEILEKIESTFGTLEKFKSKFEESAKDRFGSGWVWLILTENNRLKIVTTSNQDNPLMNTEKEKGYPLLGLDLWEHAYYLKYKNKRDKYISNFWKVVNWDFVNDQYTTQIKRNKY